MFRVYLIFNGILFINALSLAQPCREVIAYFPSWKWYDRNQLVNPASIDYSKYSVINFAFFQPNPDGSIMPFDPWADKSLLLGKIKDSAPPGYGRWKDFGVVEWHERESSLVERAHQKGVKVLISVGGWTLSEHFSAIAASETKRRRFAQSCAEMVRVYGIDGIDIDWEYPGFSSSHGAASDKQNFPLLLKAIRDSLNSLEWTTGKNLLLSAAFGVAPTRMADIEWRLVAPLLDFVNMMTYDFYGSNFGLTNHHAPLFSPKKGLDGFDLHSAVHRLMNFHGVPSEKINIGLPFYGRSQKTKGSPNLHVASRRAPDTRTFSDDAGNPTFYNILSQLSLFQYNWDSLAQVPYLSGKSSLNTFVSYDDENSIALKAKYILEHRLAGAIIWDITGDCVESRPGSGIIARTPLADALTNALCERHERVPVVMEFYALPQRWHKLSRRTYAPRLFYQASLSKKELKRLKKRQKKARRNPPGAPFFDQHW